MIRNKTRLRAGVLRPCIAFWRAPQIGFQSYTRTTIPLGIDLFVPAENPGVVL